MKEDKTALLVAQLGTPEEPTEVAVRSFLNEFLQDSAVIRMPKIFWLPILKGVILRTRPAKVAKMYESIWLDGKAPLLFHTDNFLQGLTKELGDNFEIECAMRYGMPALAEGCNRLYEKGFRSVVLFPQFPQYSKTTTGSVISNLEKHIKRSKLDLRLQIIESFAQHAGYISAEVELINNAIKEFRPEKLIISYHGLPESYITNDEPYQKMCEATTAALVPELQGIKSEQVIHTYQSRFGREPWIKPYTDKVVEEFAGKGIKRILVTCPGFTVDCLETLHEIGVELKAGFIEAGGEELNLVPSLNSNKLWVKGAAQIVKDFIKAT